MKRFYTQTEQNNLLKGLTVVSDSREQVNEHILGYFDKNKIPHLVRKLDVGDYSAMLGENTIEHKIAIEKKNSIDEIAGNFTIDRQRFEDEFIRAKAKGTKVFLVIENCSWEDIFLHNYRSKLEPKSLMASLMAWQVRYNISVVFCKRNDTAKIIYSILYYAMKEELRC